MDDVISSSIVLRHTTKRARIFSIRKHRIYHSLCPRYRQNLLRRQNNKVFQSKSNTKITERIGSNYHYYLIDASAQHHPLRKGHNSLCTRFSNTNRAVVYQMAIISLTYIYTFHHLHTFNFSNTRHRHDDGNVRAYAIKSQKSGQSSDLKFHHQRFFSLDTIFAIQLSLVQIVSHFLQKY